jgi:hypothetical protein
MEDGPTETNEVSVKRESLSRLHRFEGAMNASPRTRLAPRERRRAHAGGVVDLDPTSNQNKICEA